MNSPAILKGLSALMAEHSLSFRMVSVQHLAELKNDLDSMYCSQAFDEGFYRERLDKFSFEIPTDFPSAASLVVIAAPQPEVILVFRWKGKDYRVTLPPTYDWKEDNEIAVQIGQFLWKGGYRLAKTNLPLKLLAVRSGLLEYGKNNIGYLPRYGSYHRLMAFFTNMPCKVDHWDLPAMIKRCDNCKACLLACPTHAIDSQRFLLHAERCLTFHNEHAGDFPAFINPSIHHCLFGCMICQRVCPENRKHRAPKECKVMFGEEETTAIMNAVPLDNAPPTIKEKLDRMCLSDDYPLMPRNLRAILVKSGQFLE